MYSEEYMSRPIPACTAPSKNPNPKGQKATIMKHTVQVTLAAIILAASTGFAFADGTHGTKFQLKNKFQGVEMQVLVYNGKDGARLVPHKVYYIDTGGTRTGKCHGQGKHRCWVIVQSNGAPFTFYRGPIKKNATCEIINYDSANWPAPYQVTWSSSHKDSKWITCQ